MDSFHHLFWLFNSLYFPKHYFRFFFFFSEKTLFQSSLYSEGGSLTIKLPSVTQKVMRFKGFHLGFPILCMCVCVCVFYFLLHYFHLLPQLISTKSGVLLWCSRLRIWHCHCCDLGHCFGVSSIMAQKFPYSLGAAKKKKKNSQK